MDDKSPGGWGVFAGLMLIMTGTFNAVEGIASLTAPTRLFIGEEKMLILDYDRWGWVLIAWGVLLVIGGGALLAGATWARVFGVTLALLNAVGHLTLIGTQPWLSILVIAINIGVIWGLTAGWPANRAPAQSAPA
ncbi:hypothetical protein O4215_18240 [Rhodococcus maanshanensis]|jgi:hypothetical protein|uniref:DUF7144 family membrane protein n=1 Tax=Rhodococcus maanshanensis TaxID=183556 RepID=UPI0022B2EF77|nr:hypothetical protein [Rhodococcus maanshanensis]MCZ4557510.1 hypothetical protein [Rhodococcus maanshanensis]